MRSTDSGIELTKNELKAILGCGPSAVLFTVAGDTVTAYATNTSMSVEAIGSAGRGALHGSWLVDSEFLKACMRQAKAKTTIVLEVSLSEDEPPVSSLFSAAFTEDFDDDGAMQTVKTGQYSWTDDAACPAPQRNPDDQNPLAYSTTHERAVPCVSLSAAHLAVVALVAKAAGRDTVAVWSQASASDPVGFEFAGPTQWRVKACPVPGDDGDDTVAATEPTGVTISSGGTSVTLTAETAKRLGDMGRKMAHGIGNRKERASRKGAGQ